MSEDAKLKMTFNFPIRVYYEDTDVGGVVYHANYLKFMERARTEWLRELGYDQTELSEKKQLIFIIRSIEIDYLRSAKFNEQLLVQTKISSIGRTYFVFLQKIFRAKEADNLKRDTLLTTAHIKVVVVNRKTFRATRIPNTLVEAFSSGN